MILSLTRARLMAAVATAFVWPHPAHARMIMRRRRPGACSSPDHTQPVVRAIDFSDGKELGRYDTKGYAALTVSASGQTVFAAQSKRTSYTSSKTGIGFSDHGEHRDLEVSDVALLPVALEGQAPRPCGAAWRSRDHFYDRGGKADIVDEAALLEGKAQVRTIDTTRPHHGVAVSMGRHVLVSGADTEIEPKPDELPRRVGARVIDRRAGRSARSANAPTCMARPHQPVSLPSAQGRVLVARPGRYRRAEAHNASLPLGFPEGSQPAPCSEARRCSFFLAITATIKSCSSIPTAANRNRLITLPTRRVDFLPGSCNAGQCLHPDGRRRPSCAGRDQGGNPPQGQGPRTIQQDGHWR